MEGTSISVERETPEGIQGDVAATRVHEMIHMQPLVATAPNYFVILSGEERSLLALCIRAHRDGHHGLSGLSKAERIRAVLRIGNTPVTWILT